jgi:PAS domain S-box-containing protein
MMQKDLTSDSAFVDLNDFSHDDMLRPILASDAAILLWELDGKRLAGFSKSAENFATSLVDEHGLLHAHSSARSRLQALAMGAASKDKLRLERLRFDNSPRASLVTCSCKMVTSQKGQSYLVTVLSEPLPVAAPKAPPAPALTALPEAPEVQPDLFAAPQEKLSSPAIKETAPQRILPKGKVRFVWEMNEKGQFVMTSGSFADMVGEDHADLSGLTWDEVEGRFALDPSGIMRELITRRETWTGRTILWRIAGTNLLVPVDLSGVPAFDHNKQFIGYRGFGVCRADDVIIDPDFENIDASNAMTSEPALLSPPASPTFEQIQPEPVMLADWHLSGEKDNVNAGWERFQTASVAINYFDQDFASLPEPEAGFPSSAVEDTPVSGPVAASNHVSEPPSADIQQEDVNETAAEASAAVPYDEIRIPLIATDQDSGLEEVSAASEAALLSTSERSAFREIARALGARFEGDGPEQATSPDSNDISNIVSFDEATKARPGQDESLTRLLDRLPVAVLISRAEHPLYANKVCFDLIGDRSLAELMERGGLAKLFLGRNKAKGQMDTQGGIAIASRHEGAVPVEAHLSTIEWEGKPASLMILRRSGELENTQHLKALELELRATEAHVRELDSILDTATDGVAVIDDKGRILSLNRSAEALFGYDQNEVAGESFLTLLAPESHVAGMDYLEGLRSNGVASVLNDGRDVLARVRQGGTIPLSMIMGRINEGTDRKFCAVLRDMSAFKKAENELLASKRAAENASAQKSDFLAKISHEIRTPLNAIIGFAEVMQEERFGAIGNERYKDYLNDIRTSGSYLISLVNDLLDLAKVEAGRMEMAFVSVNLNDLVAECVNLLQPQAARSRIVMRTSFAPKLPPIVADERSMRQVILNLVTNAIKFTDAGGQIIVSTALTDRGEAAFRVRDTGIGMTEKEIQSALEPFRQLATSRRAGGTGLGLPLTKALVEANRGALLLSSVKAEGTLVEVLFPPTRVLAE